MCLNNLADYGKTKAGSFFVFSAGKFVFVETFPDLTEIFFRITDSIIFNRNKNFLFPLRCLHCGCRLWIAEIDRVLQQLVKYLLDLAVISMDVAEPVCS